MQKKMPVGIQSFRKLREGDHYYTDKTRFIDDFLFSGAEVTLVTRPRRFGKSLLIDMVSEFFDVTKDSSAIFEGLDVMDGPNAGRINSLPVLYFSFKGCEGDASRIQADMADVIGEEYRRYRFIREKLSEDDVVLYDKIFSDLRRGDANYFWLNRSIFNLSGLVSRYFGQKVLILIDEYDAPMMSAYNNRYYGDLRDFFRSLFGTALKGNVWMGKAILTGVQRIAKEGILSELSNLKVYTVAHARHSGSFGFTEAETRELLENCGLSLDDSVRQMYNGYRFGNSRLYNPWDIINYAEDRELAGFWTGTAGDGVLVEKMRVASPQFIDSMEEILTNGSAQVEVNLEMAVYEDNSDSVTWGLFVNAGYLTFADVPDPEGEIFTLCIPNRQVRKALLDVIKRYYGLGSINALLHLFKPLLENRDTEAFAKKYRDIVLRATSFHDDREYAYHMLMLGMCLSLEGYEVTSNREAGYGPCDILLKPKGKGRFAVIIEYKQGEEKELDSLAKAAIQQVKRKDYMPSCKITAFAGFSAQSKRSSCAARCHMEYGCDTIPIWS